MSSVSFFVTVGLNHVTWAFSRSEMLWGLRVPVRALIPEALVEAGEGKVPEEIATEGNWSSALVGPVGDSLVGLGHGESLVDVELVHIGQG